MAVPFSGLVHRVEQISTGPIEVSLLPPPPIPLPEDDKLNVAPNEEDVDAELLDDEPVQQPEESEAQDAEAVPVPTPPLPSESPTPPAAEPPEPAVESPDGQAATEVNADEQQAERDRRRRERLEERRRRFEERRKKRQRGSGGQRGGAPDTGEWKTGQPDAVYACTATDRGTELKVNKERSIHDWATIVPTALAGFRTRPDLGDYLDDMSQIVSRERRGLRRLGFAEMALPNEVMHLELDEPRGVRLAVGRLDGRCLVGIKYASNLFPVALLRAPIRIVDGTNASSALVDFVLYKDVSFEMRSVDGTVLPFTKGRLKNGKAITQNIEDHYQAARFAKAVADAFGISWGNKSSSSSKKKSALAAGDKNKHAER
jgi:hypothetical protein